MRDRLQALQNNLNQALVGKPDKVELILVALLGGESIEITGAS